MFHLWTLTCQPLKKELLSLLNVINVKAIAIKADVGKESDVKSAVEQTVETFGRLDIMVYRFSTLQLYFLIFILQFYNASLFILIKRLHS